MAAKTKNSETYLNFKGRPLVRSGDTIYYGHMWDKFVVVLQVMNKTKLMDQDISAKINIHLVSTDPSLPMNKRVIKQTEKEGLYNALDIACIWLDRELKDPTKE